MGWPNQIRRNKCHNHSITTNAFQELSWPPIAENRQKYGQRPTAFSDMLSPWLDVGEDMSCRKPHVAGNVVFRPTHVFVFQTQCAALSCLATCLGCAGFSFLFTYVLLTVTKFHQTLETLDQTPEWLIFTGPSHQFLAHCHLHASTHSLELELFKLRLLCVLLRLKQYVFFPWRWVCWEHAWMKQWDPRVRCQCVDHW